MGLVLASTAPTQKGSSLKGTSMLLNEQTLIFNPYKRGGKSENGTVATPASKSIHLKNKIHGPVVQSIISLTSSLRGQLVKCFTTL